MRYPIFTKSGGMLRAFLNPTTMFQLNEGAYGKGHGFEFRIFKTRATCRRYETDKNEISYKQFVAECQLTLGKYLIELTDLLPEDLKNLESGPGQKLLQ